MPLAKKDLLLAWDRDCMLPSLKSSYLIPEYFIQDYSHLLDEIVHYLPDTLINLLSYSDQRGENYWGCKDWS